MRMYCSYHKKKHEASGWRGRIVDGEHQWNCDESIGYPEFTPDYIKEDRKKHAVDLVQPRVGGDPNPEFLEHYPEQAKKHYSSEEMRKVKRVII